MTRKRRSTSAKSSPNSPQASTSQSHTRTPSQPASRPPTSSLRPPSSAENFFNHATAVVLASFQLISQGGSAALLPIGFIILTLVLVPTALYLLSVYILFPVWAYVRYPFIPFIWLATKGYTIVYWVVSWGSAIFKAIAWLGFYIFFFGQAFTYALSFLEWVGETLRETDEEAAAKKRAQAGEGDPSAFSQHASQDIPTENWPQAGEDDGWSDDEGPPPLEPATR